MGIEKGSALIVDDRVFGGRFGAGMESKVVLLLADGAGGGGLERDVGVGTVMLGVLIDLKNCFRTHRTVARRGSVRTRHGDRCQQLVDDARTVQPRPSAHGVVVDDGLPFRNLRLKDRLPLRVVTPTPRALIRGSRTSMLSLPKVPRDAS